MNTNSIDLYVGDFSILNTAIKGARTIQRKTKKPVVVRLSRIENRLETGISTTYIDRRHPHGESVERIQLNKMEEDFNSIAQNFIERISMVIDDKDPNNAMKYLAKAFLRSSRELTKEFIIAAAEEIHGSERDCLIEKISTGKKPEEPHQKIINGKQKYPGPHENALEWIKEVWGDYLKFFGADDDYIYQDQLANLDKKLMDALRYNRKYRNEVESKGLKLSDIIPTKKDRLDKEIANLDPDVTKKIKRLGWVSQKRHTPS